MTAQQDGKQLCATSDSRLPEHRCWCAECRDERKKTKLLSVRPVNAERTRWIVTVSK